MAHVQTTYAGLWKPQDLGIDKISSQKMFIDNVNQMEAIALSLLQNVHQSVKTLADLRAINTTDVALFKTGMLIMVQDNGLYSFNRSSTADDDNNAVIKPTVGVGRWITTTTSDVVLSGRQVSSSAELDEYLLSVLSNMSNLSIKNIIVNAVVAFQPFGGGTIHMTIYKVNTAYTSIEARIYYSSPNVVLQFTRSRYNNVWGNWHRQPYLDENGKIPLDQLPSGVLTASIE